VECKIVGLGFGNGKVMLSECRAENYVFWKVEFVRKQK
jgi:hypothetical protein